MIVTLTTDFGVQSQGIGMMEAVIAEIAPAARTIHYAHGLSSFDIASAARVLETLEFVPPAIHVCVCDPGVGTERRPVAIETGRGDMLIGPDNGVLLPAAALLGDIRQVREITNRAAMRGAISSVFHGRDIFCPVAAHLAKGMSFGELGPILAPKSLVSAPYREATEERGRWRATVIHIDKFGNAHLNIRSARWSRVAPQVGEIRIEPAGRPSIVARRQAMFGAVGPGEPVVIEDNDGRVSLAVNHGSFAEQHGIRAGDSVELAFDARQG